MGIFFNLQSTSATTVYGYNGGALEYDGYIWVLGGSAGTGYGATRNIIRSANLGVNWELVTTASNIGNSNSSGLHASIVYGGYMWVIGGLWSGGTALQFVRRTTDGISFSYLTYPDVGGTACVGVAVCIHNGRLYMSGGTYYGTNCNAVHSTTDGLTWTTHHANGGSGGLPIGFSGHVMYSFNGRLWIGTNSSLYYSEDNGSNWSLYSAGVAPFNSTGLAKNAVVAFGYVYVMSYNGTSLYYSENGGDFSLESPISGTTTANGAYDLALVDERIMLTGGVGNLGSNYGRTYLSTSMPHYASYVRFSSSVIHSPSPAYLRLTDASEIYDVSGGEVLSYERIWSLRNNRTSAITYYTSEESYIDLSVSGIYGDTFDVSLSAVW